MQNVHLFARVCHIQEVVHVLFGQNFHETTVSIEIDELKLTFDCWCSTEVCYRRLFLNLLAKSTCNEITTSHWMSNLVNWIWLEATFETNVWLILGHFRYMWKCVRNVACQYQRLKINWMNDSFINECSFARLMTTIHIHLLCIQRWTETRSIVQWMFANNGVYM